MINKQPAQFLIERLEVGYTKARIQHNTPKDLDISSRSFWVKEEGTQKESANRVDIPYTSKDYAYLEGLSSDTLYDIDAALVDEFVSGNLALLQAQYLDTANVLTLASITSVNTLKTPIIVAVESNNTDQGQIGSPASTVAITFEGVATNSYLEASSDNWETSKVLYTGPISNDTILVSMSAGAYKFRLTPTFTFSDGIVDSGEVFNYVDEVSVAGSILPPSAVSGLSTSAFKILDNVASYNLRVAWDWDLDEGGQRQNTLVDYMEVPNSTVDLSTLDWSLAVSLVSLGEDTTIVSAPYRKTIAIRLKVQGWNGGASSYVYTRAFISEITEDSDILGYLAPSEGNPLAPDTKIYLDSRYFQGYDPDNKKTFEFDALTGNFTIGSAGTYGGASVVTPFQFDAAAARLSIAGETITNSIVSANYVLGWLGGETPNLRTANKLNFADGTNGMWMGYSDSETFKVDIGSATQYLRWDGKDLIISGNVKIAGGGTVGQKQKSATLFKIFPKGSTTLTPPTGGTYLEPVSTDSFNAGWLSASPVFDDTTEAVYSSSRLFTSDGGEPQDDSWSAVGLYTTGGGTGAPAPYISLSSNTSTFLTDSTAFTSPNFIAFSVVSGNLNGPITWSTEPAVTLTGTGTSRSLSYSAMGPNKSVMVTVTDGVISDSINVVVISDGVDGLAGERGIPGADGSNSYFHIAYADTSTGTGFSQDSAGKKYIGTYVDSVASDAAYNSGLWNWQLVKGLDGNDGIPGTDGSDGQTSY